jgi:hypothetical protein
MAKKKAQPRAKRGDDVRRESGQPGGGAGRRDEVGPTGVYPMSAGIPRGKHLEIRTPATWGQGERGAEGYEDSGRSGLVWKDGQLLGGSSSASSGEQSSDLAAETRGREPAKKRGASNPKR